MSDEGMSDAELIPIAIRDLKTPGRGALWGPSSDWDYAELIERLSERLDAAERERDALREALRPFAMVAEHDIDNSEHDNDLYVGNGGRYNRAPSLHVRHFRAALTANHSAPVVEE